MEPDDERLVLACRAGDAAAWETLVNRYARLVWSIARRAGLDDARAGDVFGHVFAALVEQLPRLEQPGRVRSWLVTTTKREAWRVARTARANVPLPDPAGDEPPSVREPADPDPLPDEVVSRLELQHLVRLALATLDERCRTLLTLLFLSTDPPPYGEIAARLGVPEGSIGPTRARCLAKLRKPLASLGYGPEAG